jgi:hypothetical protein
VCGGMDAGCELVHNDCATKAAAIIAKLPGKLFKIFECKKCATAIVRALQREGIHGQVITATADRSYKAGLMVSDLAAPGVTISRNGIHQGVQVGDIVFDNLTPGGVAVSEWKSSLHAPGKAIDFSVEPF